MRSSPARSARAPRVPRLVEGRGGPVVAALALLLAATTGSPRQASAAMSGTPAWTTESDQAGAELGWSVASAGDVNGDGYADVVVGAWKHDSTKPDEGSAFVYHGSASGLATTPSWTVHGGQAAAWLGWSVASAGDVNQDGHDDVVVGALGGDATRTDAGLVLVYLGSPSGLSTTPVTTIAGSQVAQETGATVAGVGDVNGDGNADVAVGMPASDARQGGAVVHPVAGAVAVYYGSANGQPFSGSWAHELAQDHAHLGTAIAGLGDVNGDGYGDLVVTAVRAVDEAATPVTGEGLVLVFQGSSTGLPSTPSWSAVGPALEDHFGFSVAGLDVNGDGHGDLAVGAPHHSNGQQDEGAVFVYLGGSSGLGSSPAWTYESDEAGAQLGISVARAGDVNGDGFDDLVAGAWWHENGQEREGRALIFLGSSGGLGSTPWWSHEPDEAGAELGRSVASAGDVNGDGKDDVIVGAWGHDGGDIDEGGAFVFLGAP